MPWCGRNPDRGGTHWMSMSTIGHGASPSGDFFGIVSDVPIAQTVGDDTGGLSESLHSYHLTPIPEPTTLGLLFLETPRAVLRKSQLRSSSRSRWATERRPQYATCKEDAAGSDRLSSWPRRGGGRGAIVSCCARIGQLCHPYGVHASAWHASPGAHAPGWNGFALAGSWLPRMRIHAPPSSNARARMLLPARGCVGGDAPFRLKNVPLVFEGAPSCSRTGVTRLAFVRTPRRKPGVIFAHMPCRGTCEYACEPAHGRFDRRLAHTAPLVRAPDHAIAPHGSVGSRV